MIKENIKDAIIELIEDYFFYMNYLYETLRFA